MSKKTKRWPSLYFYDLLDVPYVVHGGGYDGPLWTGVCMMLDASDSYEDAGFFHELLHWMMASERQRRYPDFALGRQVNSNAQWFTSSTTEHICDPTSKGVFKRTKDHNWSWGEKAIPLEKARAQEDMACYGLWFYEPLIGLWDWGDWPDHERINTAAYDFAGDFRNTKTYFTPVTAKRCHKHFISLLDESISVQTVENYFKMLAEQIDISNESY